MRDPQPPRLLEKPQWAAVALAVACLAGASPAGAASLRVPLPSPPALAVPAGQPFSAPPSSLEPGLPGLPVETVTVRLPAEADVRTVTARIELEYRPVAGRWEVDPAPPQLVAGVAIWPPGRLIRSGRDALTYAADADVPAEALLGLSAGQSGDWCLAEVRFCRYRYNPVRRVLLLGSGSLALSYEVGRRARDEVLAVQSRLPAQEALLRARTLNWEGDAMAVAGPAGPTGPGAGGAPGGMGGPAPPGMPGMPGAPAAAAAVPPANGYAIITTAQICDACPELKAFAAAKEARGWRVTVAREADWGGGKGNAAADNLRRWLQRNYRRLALRYVLLVGNPDPGQGDVPMKMCFAQKREVAYAAVPTDFYYSELTGDWDLDGDGFCGEFDGDRGPGGVDTNSEVTVGRLPLCGGPAALGGLLTRLTAYEQALGSTPAAPRALLAMKPSDKQTPGFHLGEEIRGLCLRAAPPWQCARLYDEPYALTPAPEYTPCTTDRALAAWRELLPGLVVWWTHGSDYEATDVLNCQQVEKLPVSPGVFAFQCSCYNARPETADNLAARLLQRCGVATVGATTVSWSDIERPSYDRTGSDAGMAVAFVRHLLQGDPAGDALRDLKAETAPELDVWWMNYLAFALYGDPSLGLVRRPVQ